MQYQISVPSASLFEKLGERPLRIGTQLLFGESFDVLGTDGDWRYGSAADGYKGYVHRDALSYHIVENNWRVNTRQALVYTEPDPKSITNIMLGFNALVCGEEREGPFILIKRAGWMRADDLVPITRFEGDYVTVATRFIGTPYLWGGRDSGMGFDCSGLVQIAFAATGKCLPRNSGDQEKELPTQQSDGRSFTRGDVVFWEGHVGIMTCMDKILHATMDHMKVITEPLVDVIERKKTADKYITSIYYNPVP